MSWSRRKTHYRQFKKQRNHASFIMLVIWCNNYFLNTWLFKFKTSVISALIQLFSSVPSRPKFERKKIKTIFLNYYLYFVVIVGKEQLVKQLIAVREAIVGHLWGNISITLAFRCLLVNLADKVMGFLMADPCTVLIALPPALLLSCSPFCPAGSLCFHIVYIPLPCF